MIIKSWFQIVIMASTLNKPFLAQFVLKLYKCEHKCGFFSVSFFMTWPLHDFVFRFSGLVRLSRRRADRSHGLVNRLGRKEDARHHAARTAQTKTQIARAEKSLQVNKNPQHDAFRTQFAQAEKSIRANGCTESRSQKFPNKNPNCPGWKDHRINLPANIH